MDSISEVGIIRDVVTTGDSISHPVVRFKTTSRIVGVAIRATMQGNVLSIAEVITSVVQALVVVTVAEILSALPVRVLNTVRQLRLQVRHRVHRHLERQKR